MPEGLAFLSEEWVSAFLAEASSLPERPGATATVSTVVTGGPDGRKAERSWRWSLRDGRIESAAAGAAAEGEADLVVSQTWDDAVAALRGEAGLDVGFMRGSTKIAGSTGVFMTLLPVLRSDGWRAAWETVAARTDL